MENGNGTTCAYNTRKGAQEQKEGCGKFRWAFIEIPNLRIPDYGKIKKFILSKNPTYYLCGQHEGEEDKKTHYHIFVQFKGPIAQNERFIKGILNCHLSRHDDYNPQGMINYIKCTDKKHIESGIKSTIIDEIGEQHGTGKYPTIKELETMSKEELKDLPIQYKRIVDQELNFRADKEAYENMINHKHKQIIIKYYFGEGGTGKTWASYDFLAKYNEKGKGTASISFDDTGKAFIHTNQRDMAKIKYVVWNEFRDSTLKLTDFLSYTLNEKPLRIMYGWQSLPNLKKIIITSSQAPEDLYKKAITENRTQIYRRLTKIKKFIKWNNKKMCPMFEDYEIEKEVKFDDELI